MLILLSLLNQSANESTLPKATKICDTFRKCYDSRITILIFSPAQWVCVVTREILGVDNPCANTAYIGSPVNLVKPFTPGAPSQVLSVFRDLQSSHLCQSFGVSVARNLQSFQEGCASFPIPTAGGAILSVSCTFVQFCQMTLLAHKGETPSIYTYWQSL